MNNKYNPTISIGVVLVTFNRLSKLKIALQCFSNQTIKPEYIIVVDNASKDGTKEFLSSWQQENDSFEKEVLFLEENTGGSGGFHSGLAAALNRTADWIWVSDDDAFPQIDALQVFSEFATSCGNELDSYSAVCGTVINSGNINLVHRRRTYTKGIKYYSDFVPLQEYSNPFLCNTFSYVGAILNKKKLEMVGITKKDYFIWFDDTEHSLRLSRVGKIVCLPKMKIDHNEVKPVTSFSWKTYYGLRNKLDTIREFFPWYCYLYYTFKYIFLGVEHLFWSNEKAFLYLRAVKDAFWRHFGLHAIYKPGWNSKK